MPWGDGVLGYLTGRWIGRLEENRWAPEEPRGHYASNLGHPCLFFLWAHRARWEEATSPETSRLCLFDLGDHYEAYAKAKLRDAGFEVLEEQRLYANEEFNIRGRIDGRIRTNDPEAPEVLRSRHGVLAEIKGLNDADWNKLNTIQDMVESSKPWVRKWPAQLGFYVEEAGDDFGIFAFVNKLTGEPNFILYDREEWTPLLGAAYHRVSRVNGYLKLGRQAPPLTFDPMYCNRCDWSHICPTAAAMTGSGEAVKMSGSQLDKLLEDVWTLEDEGRRYHSGRDAVKAMLVDAGVWPAEGMTRTVITDGFTLLLEMKGGRKHWSIATKRGGTNGNTET